MAPGDAPGAFLLPVRLGLPVSSSFRCFSRSRILARRVSGNDLGIVGFFQPPVRVARLFPNRVTARPGIDRHLGLRHVSLPAIGPRIGTTRQGPPSSRFRRPLYSEPPAANISQAESATGNAPRLVRTWRPGANSRPPRTLEVPICPMKPRVVGARFRNQPGLLQQCLRPRCRPAQVPPTGRHSILRRNMIPSSTKSTLTTLKTSSGPTGKRAPLTCCS